MPLRRVTSTRSVRQLAVSIHHRRALYRFPRPVGAQIERLQASRTRRHRERTHDTTHKLDARKPFTDPDVPEYRNPSARGASPSAEFVPPQVADRDSRRRLPSVVAQVRDEGTTSLRDELEKRPEPELSCPECPTDEVVVGQKSADGAKIQRWFECREYGYGSRSEIVYGPER